LIGLKTLDPKTFAARVQPYRSMSTEVQFLTRDVLGMEKVSTAVKWIEKGKFDPLVPDSLRPAKATPEARWIPRDG
jgi:hypothetical protein